MKVYVVPVFQAALKDQAVQAGLGLFNKLAAPAAGEQGLDEGVPGVIGPKQLPDKLRRPLQGVLRVLDAVQHLIHYLGLQCVRQIIQILIVGVEGGFVDDGLGAQLLDGDLLQGTAGPQLQKCVEDALPGLFSPQVHGCSPPRQFQTEVG